MSSTFNVTFSTKMLFACAPNGFMFSYLPFPRFSLSHARSTISPPLDVRSVSFFPKHTRRRNMDREICLMDLCTWKNVWRSLGENRPMNEKKNFLRHQTFTSARWIPERSLFDVKENETIKPNLLSIEKLKQGEFAAEKSF